MTGAGALTRSDGAHPVDRRTTEDRLALAMDPTLQRIARWLESRAWNLPASDKTWVLAAMWAALVFQREVRRAQRVDAR